MFDDDTITAMVVADRLLIADDDTITQEKLQALGFDAIHWNAKWNGGWMEYYRMIEDLRRVKIKVTFGDGYSEDFMVWIECDFTSIAMKHIRTMTQLADFYRLVTGREI